MNGADDGEKGMDEGSVTGPLPPDRYPLEAGGPNAVPRSTFLWLALFLLTFGVTFALDRWGEAPGSRGAPGTHSTAPGRSNRLHIRASDFDTVQENEIQVRAGYALRVLGELSGDSSDSSPKSRTPDQRNGDRELTKAAAAYRTLAPKTPGPNTPRRVLILEHQLGKPLDEAFLEKELVGDLKGQDTPSEDINAELRLWQAMYGKGEARPPLSPDELPAQEKRIEEMRLGFLQNQALADLYTAGGNPSESKTYQGRIRVLSLRYVTVQTVMALGGFGAFVLGTGTLIFFLVNVARNRWDRLGFQNDTAPETFRPRHIGFGALLDVFVAYLTLNKILALVLGLLVGAFLTPPSVETATYLTAFSYVFPAVLAILYLRRTLRQTDCPWSEIGMPAFGGNSEPKWIRFWHDIGVGVLGWFTSLPLLLILGILSHLIFKNNPDVSPNPVIPMTVGETDPFARFLLFLLTVVAAPFIEETFFRGALLTGLRARYGWMVSVALSALCFAVVHPMQDWLPIFGLGVTLGTLRVVRNSLVPGMTAHALQNGFAFLFLSSLFSS